jgi:hypothetical protein
MTSLFCRAALLAAASALSFSAAAEPMGEGKREFADIYTQCGLGAMIAPTNEVVAAITNVTWDLGTTAILSNASSAENCKGGAAKKAAFIHNAYPKLAQDLARGDGQHLRALVTLAGCKADSQGQVMTAMRGEFAQLTAVAAYAQQSRFQQSEALFTAVNQRLAQDFAQTCTAV